MNTPRQDEIAAQLARKGADKPCPRCGGHDFEIEQLVPQVLSQAAGRGWICAGVTCSNCGYLALHVDRVLAR